MKIKCPPYWIFPPQFLLEFCEVSVFVATSTNLQCVWIRKGQLVYILNKGQVNLSGLTTPQCSTCCQTPGFSPNYNNDQQNGVYIGALSLSKLQKHTFLLTVWQKSTFVLNWKDTSPTASIPWKILHWLILLKNLASFQEIGYTFLHSWNLIMISAIYWFVSIPWFWC